MFENQKKSSKSKLEMRDCDDRQEENIILQENRSVIAGEVPTLETRPLVQLYSFGPSLPRRSEEDGDKTSCISSLMWRGKKWAPSENYLLDNTNSWLLLPTAEAETITGQRPASNDEPEPTKDQFLKTGPAILKKKKKSLKIKEKSPKIENNLSKIEEKSLKTEDKCSKLENNFPKIKEKSSQKENNLSKIEDTSKIDNKSSKINGSSSKTEKSPSINKESSSIKGDVLSKALKLVLKNAGPKKEKTPISKSPTWHGKKWEPSEHCLLDYTNSWLLEATSDTEEAAADEPESMKGESSKIEDISSKVEEISSKVEEISSKVEEKSSKVEEISSKVEEISSKVEEKFSKVEEKSSKTEDILEVIRSDKGGLILRKKRIVINALPNSEKRIVFTNVRPEKKLASVLKVETIKKIKKKLEELASRKEDSSAKESSKEEASANKSSKEASANKSSKEETLDNKSSKEEASAKKSSKEEASAKKSSKEAASSNKSSKEEALANKSLKEEPSANESSKEESSANESLKEEEPVSVEVSSLGILRSRLNQTRGSSASPRRLDHTYAIPSVTPMVIGRPPSPFTDLVKSISPSTPALQTMASAKSTSPTLQISVKVEVEEFIENTPPKRLKITHRKQKLIPISEVDLDELYNIADEINRAETTNLADKHLSVEVKNIWGRALKPEEVCDPYELMIQQAFNSWCSSVLNNPKIYREPPLFYQCRICMLAWWYLQPFQNHIRTHDHTKLIILHLESGFETFFVATDQKITDIVYIPCEGNCFRCGNPFNYHVKENDELYKCKVCSLAAATQFETCLGLRNHENMEQCIFPAKVKRTHDCMVCPLKFFTAGEVSLHMITAHDVRSDVIVPLVTKKCPLCSKFYLYHSYHTCSRSPMSASCKHCYRKFHTKVFLDIHHQFVGKSNFVCQYCGMMLEAQCEKTEHMLTHSEHFCVAYKCPLSECPNYFFPDLDSVRMHKTAYHKQKFDKRRTYYETVIVPTRCVKTGFFQMIDSTQENTGVMICSKDDFTDEDADWCIPSVSAISDRTDNNRPATAKHTYRPAKSKSTNRPTSSNKQANKQASKTTNIANDDDDDVIIIGQNEEPPIEIESDGEEFEMDYAEMLSKVFKVDSTVNKPRSAPEKIRTEIKLEPTNFDIDNMIDIEEDIIILKQEPIEACLGKSFQSDSFRTDISQSDSCQDDSQMDISQIDSCEDESQTNLSQSASCQDDSQTSRPQSDISRDGTIQAKDISFENDFENETSLIIQSVKSEPMDYDTVSETDITVVKMEPEDVKKELRGCSEVDDNTDINQGKSKDELVVFVTTESDDSKDPIFEPEPTVGKPKRNRESRKSTIYRKLIVQRERIQQRKVIFEKNKINQMYKDAAEILEKISPVDIDTKPIKDLAINRSGKKMKIQKLYRCCKCGYTNLHKFYVIHRNSQCELCPMKDNDGAWSRKVPIIRRTSYLCSKCDTGFSSLRTYLGHFTEHGYGALACPSCGLKFEEAKELLAHFHKHLKQSFLNCWVIDSEGQETAKKQITCQTCRETVLPKDVFPHWESHLTLRESKVQLPAVHSPRGGAPASKRTLEPDLLNLTLQQLRAETNRERDCMLCYRKFTRRNDIKRHLIEHLLIDALAKKDGSENNTLRCQMCSEEFFRLDEYKFHMRSHGGLPVYRCGLCDRTFSDSSNFAKHKKVHNMKVLICDICNKKFQAKSSIEKHMIMHQTTEPIQCESCPRVFYSRSHYNKHRTMVHMRHKTRFRCVVCNVWFNTMQEKWEHAWEVHRERRDRADCPVCGLAFRKYQDVKNHAKTDHQVELKYYNAEPEAQGSARAKASACRLRKTKKRRIIVPVRDSEGSS